MEDVVDEVGRLMPGWRVQSAVKLRGSTRTVVHRLAALDEHGRPVSVVAKQYPAKVQASVREAAALAVLAPGLPAPRLLAERADPPLLVMSDVGAGQSVADALLGGNADLAEEAVCDWAGALGALHARTLGVGAAFAVEIDSRAGELAVSVDPTPGYLIAAAGALNDRSAEVGVAGPASWRDELTDLAGRIAGTDVSALSPTDACPDNNARDEHGRLSLVDFEGAAFRPVAWDVAYLRVPWPSCWCSWRIPDSVADQAVERYQAALRPALPWVATDGFTAAVDNAIVAWALISAGWFIDMAVAGDPPPNNPGIVAPPRRAFLLHRLALAEPIAARRDLPGLAATLQAWQARLLERWGPQPLAPAPAFRR